MVTYGEWTQDPDYPERPSYSFSESDPRWTRTGGESSEEVWETPDPYPITEDDLRNSIQAAGIGGSVSYRFEYTLTYPDWISKWSATKGLRSFNLALPDYPFWYSPWPTPDDAIGLHYEGTTYDPDDPWPWGESTPQRVALYETTQLQAGIWDTSAGGIHDLSQPFSTDLRLDTGGEPIPLAALSGGPTSPGLSNTVDRPLGATIDLTDYVGTTWQGALFTRTDELVPPKVGPEPYENGRVTYGWNLNRVVLEWTVRPPRYRWVYADAPVPPIRRTFPRDDGLAGGAPRTYPQSQAFQSSNRTFGGYL